MPRDAPKPMGIFDDLLRRGPGLAIFREEYAALSRLVFPIGVIRTACNDHEAAVRSDAQVGVAKIDARFIKERLALPFAPVLAGKDPELAVIGLTLRRGVALAFAENGVPLVVPADQVAEGRVRGLVPDLGDGDELPFGGIEHRCEEK